MTNKTIALTPEIYHYLLANSCREPALFQQLRQETALLKQAAMQISPDQGQFMGLLVKLLDAQKALEIGVFTGYSGLWIASSLPTHGKLVACEINETWAAIASDYWAKAGIRDKIDLQLGPALATLEQLLGQGEANSFDFIFIDADKANQENYYELSLQLARPGGLILLDNVLWSGKVVDSTINDQSTQIIRDLNAKLARDKRIDISLIAIGDGLTLARKK